MSAWRWTGAPSEHGDRHARPGAAADHAPHRVGRAVREPRAASRAVSVGRRCRRRSRGVGPLGCHRRLSRCGQSVGTLQRRCGHDVRCRRAVRRRRVARPDPDGQQLRPAFRCRSTLLFPLGLDPTALPHGSGTQGDRLVLHAWRRAGRERARRLVPLGRQADRIHRRHRETRHHAGLPSGCRRPRLYAGTAHSVARHRRQRQTVYGRIIL